MKSTIFKTTLVIAICLAGAMNFTALGAGTPKIQFDKLVYDFGKTSLVETVSGTFKYTNEGDDILKLEPPKLSCGCTTAGLKPDTLKPGESGELAFTLSLGRARANMEKHITVMSNDPKTPVVSLAIKVDYTPLYDLNPMALALNLPFGTNEAGQFTTITRTDGKPLVIQRLDVSKPWITARVEPAGGADASTARIGITIQREGVPRRFNEYVHIYAADQTNGPVSSIYLYGQFMGQVSLSPEALYWSVTGTAPTTPAPPEAQVVRRVNIRSASGEPIEIKNPKSTIPGIQVELVSKDSGKAYELVAKLNETPDRTVSGNVSFETSVPAQARMEVPVIVNVFKP